jgi:hypothetical protein
MYKFLSQVLAKYTLVTSDFKTVEKKFLDKGIEKSKVKDALERFKKLRDRNKLKGDEKNIDFWGSKPFKEFKERIEDLEKTKTSTEKKKGKVDLRENIPGAEFITENDEWTVYEITTNEASHKLGQGTEWCIKHEKSEHWNIYDSDNTIYFLISKTRDQKDPWSKTALLVNKKGHKTYWDRADKDHKSVPNNLKLPSFKLKIPPMWKADSSGNINVSEKGLTSLKGAPQKVDEGFDCSDNNLTSLEGAPQTVGRDFECNNNNLTSLEGAPQTVGRDFECNNNNLTSLEGAPPKVGGDFIAATTNSHLLRVRLKRLVGVFLAGTTTSPLLRERLKRLVGIFIAASTTSPLLRERLKRLVGIFIAGTTPKNSLKKKSVRYVKLEAKCMYKFLSQVLVKYTLVTSDLQDGREEISRPRGSARSAEGLPGKIQVLTGSQST